jgi:hypothetical protein
MLASAVLAAMLAWGLTNTLLTAFEISDFGVSVDKNRMLLWIMASAVLSAAAAEIKHAGVAGLLPVAGAVLYLCANQRLLISLEALLFQITVPYHEAYKCGRIRWSTTPLTEGEPSMWLILLGAVTVWLTVRAVHGCGRRTPVVIGAAALLVCIGVPAVTPDLLPVLCLISGMILLLILGNMTGKPNERTRMLSILLAPVLLSTLIVLITVPEGGLGVMPQDITAKVSEWLSSGLGGLSSLFRGDGFVTATIFSEKVELDKQGPRKESEAEVMTVSGDYTGRLYLRGMAYDVYTGTDWKVSGGSWVMDDQYIRSGRRRVTMTITTKNKHKVYYVPCYPDLTDELNWTQGKVPNTSGDKTYEMMCMQEIRSLQLDAQKIYINGDWNAWLQYNSELLRFDPDEMKQYLQLPERSADAIRACLQAVEEPKQTSGNADIRRARYMYEYAQRIAKYVQTLAVYDTDTGRMPKGEKDFAVWFMETQNTGYCVHFATAATVLLRAAGIPARYVTGYMTTFPKNSTNEVTVRQKEAHAWVEYWLPGVGWMILDATPAAQENTPGTPASSDRPSGNTSSQRPDGSSSQKPDSSSSQRPGNSSSQRPGTSSSQGDTSRPGESGSSQPDEEIGMKIPWQTIGRWMLGLLNILMIPVVLWGQWAVRLWYHRRRMHTGSPNRQARVRWKYCRRMAKLLRQEVPANLRELTEKACFSQHRLTAAELSVYADYLADGEARLRKKPQVLQVLYRVIFAVY